VLQPAPRPRWPGTKVVGAAPRPSASLWRGRPRRVADDRLVGLWRAYRYETETLQLTLDGGAVAAAKARTYTYDLSGTSTYTATYGNLTSVYESDSSGPLRHTDHDYFATPPGDTAHYIVDRLRADNVYDASGKLARTVYGYDGRYNGTFGTVGDLALTRKYYDLPGTPNTDIHSTDVSQGYDAFGNVITTSTSIAPGREHLCPAGTQCPEWFAPGDGSPARTITTTYDLTFHRFPTEIDQPQTSHGTLRQYAGYDYQMGTLTAITDTNGNVTSAGYDTFARLSSVIKPGDSAPAPTQQMVYSDTEQPFPLHAVPARDGGRAEPLDATVLRRAGPARANQEPVYATGERNPSEYCRRPGLRRLWARHADLPTPLRQRDQCQLRAVHAARGYAVQSHQHDLRCARSHAADHRA
jgi:YD repeat-containing protein